MLRFLGVAEEDLEDLCQDVLLGAYRSFPRYDPMHSSNARAAALLDSPDTLGSVMALAQAAIAAGSAPGDTPPRPRSTRTGAPDPSRRDLERRGVRVAARAAVSLAGELATIEEDAGAQGRRLCPTGDPIGLIARSMQ
ncbi:sigma factor [Sorangium sp. So ce375]|uniref:sigma factor n=1 Tax=Sorangium sp. So ce375 TaxID=3133306 RepID=UPI003F5BEF78